MWYTAEPQRSCLAVTMLVVAATTKKGFDVKLSRREAPMPIVAATTKNANSITMLNGSFKSLFDLANAQWSKDRPGPEDWQGLLSNIQDGTVVEFNLVADLGVGGARLLSIAWRRRNHPAPAGAFLRRRPVPAHRGENADGRLAPRECYSPPRNALGCMANRTQHQHRSRDRQSFKLTAFKDGVRPAGGMSHLVVHESRWVLSRLSAPK